MKRKRRQNRKRRYLPSTLSYSGPARLSAPRVHIDPELAWFAVWTKARTERKAEQRIREAGFATYLPSFACSRTRRGVVLPLERLAVGRYLFVGLPARQTPFGEVAALDEVQSFVSVAGMPLRLPAEALQRFSDGLASRTLTLRSWPLARLLALMAQADDARERERGPFWTAEEAA
jgi:hypothetical protein